MAKGKSARGVTDVSEPTTPNLSLKARRDLSAVLIAELFVQTSERLSRNFQLHPPIGRDDDIATNDSGNLRLPKMFEAVEDRGKVSVMTLSERPTGQSDLISTGRWDRKAGLTQELEKISATIMSK